MGIFDLFTKQVAPAQQQQQQAPNGQQQSQQQSPVENQHVQNNQTVPNSVNTPANPEGTSPVDQFKSLWQPMENPQPNAQQAPLININQEQLSKQISGMDFAKNISPELFQKVAAGGDDAVKAMAQIVNVLGQQVTAQSLIGSSMVTESAVKTYGDRFQKDIPNFIKQQSITEQRKELNPALSNPAFEPMVQAVESQMRIKYPSATAGELTQMVSNYFDEFGKAVNAPKEQEQLAKQKAQSKDTDWDAFLQNGGSLANM